MCSSLKDIESMLKRLMGRRGPDPRVNQWKLSPGRDWWATGDWIWDWNCYISIESEGVYIYTRIYIYTHTHICIYIYMLLLWRNPTSYYFHSMIILYCI